MANKKEEVRVHKASRPKFECTRCHKAYPSTLDLEEHIRYDHPASASAAG